jgi:hypothetical protein
MKFYSKAIELNPDFTFPRYMRSIILRFDEKYVEALKEAKIVFELDKNYEGI